jgi:ParB/RepB/Spo0J family partition protein
VSEFNRRSPLSKPEYVPSRDEAFDDSVFDQAAAERVPADGREGLPPTFRMRHDEHYVDHITSRAVAQPIQLIAVTEIDGARPLGWRELSPLVESINSFGVVQPLLVRRQNGRYQLISGSKRLAAAIAAGLTEVPCLLEEADDERARALAEAANLRIERETAERDSTPAEGALPARAAREIIDSLATITSCLNLFLDRERPLRERVATTLVRTEARRARWLAEAYLVLGGAPPVVRKPFNPSALVEHALQDLEAEGRLSNVELGVIVDEPARKLLADERLMLAALTGAAGAMLGLLQGAGGATLKIHVSTHPATQLLAFQLSQDLVPAPPSGIAELDDDASVPEWPGGHGASLGLAVARRVAQLHGGRVEIIAGPRTGCTITLMLPTGD